MDFSEYWQILQESINKIEVKNGNGCFLSLEEGLKIATHHIVQQSSLNKKIIFIGNGGSASIASHMAIDFWKNGKIKAICFNDAAQLTCLANDLGVERIFSLPIKVFAQEEDILVAISSSGKSSNILEAVKVGREKKCWIITLSGFSSQNPLRNMGHLNFYVPYNSYGIVESIHAILCHHILDRIICKDKNFPIYDDLSNR